MSAVVKAVSKVVDTVVDAVGDVVDVAVDVVEDVVETAGKVIETALDDPIRTIATVAAIAAGQPQLIPVINAADTLADGGSFEDALESAAISYVAQGAGNYVGSQLGTALEYGTDLGSAQTAQLAAQSGDMLAGTTSGTIGGAAGAATAGATAAALSGGDVDQAFINALGNYVTRTGINYSINELGQLVDEFGNEAPLEVVNEISSDMGEELEQLSGPTEDLGPTTTQSADETYTQTFDDGSTITTDAAGNIISSTTYDGNTILPTPAPSYDTASTTVDNQDGTYTQTFDDGSTLTTDTEGNVVSSTTYDGDIIYPGAELQPTGDLSPTQTTEDSGSLSNVANAAGKYFTNQFVNQLTRQIMGGPETTGGFRPAPSVGLSKLPGVSDYLFSLGYDYSQMPSALTFTDASSANTSPIKLWDPGIDLDWAPETKLGGLGFAGKFINQEDDQQYINKDEEERQRLAEEVRTRGWITEEERQILEQGSPYYSVDEEPITDTQTSGLDLGYAAGGLIDHNPEFFSEGGASLANRFVRGEGDGTSDSVPAMLAKGEFVFPADVVSGLGNGDNEAGAKVLDEFMKSVRQHKRAADPSNLPPDSKGPLEYLAEAQKKVGKKHGRT